MGCGEGLHGGILDWFFVWVWCCLTFPGDPSVYLLLRTATLWLQPEKEQDCHLQPPPASIRCPPTLKHVGAHPASSRAIDLSQGQWNWTEETAGFPNKEEIRYLLCPAQLWGHLSVKFQWLHGRVWMWCLSFYLLSTKHLDNPGKFLKWFSKYSHPKLGVLYLKTWFTKILPFCQTPLPPRRRWWPSASVTKAPHLPGFWGPGTCQAPDHTSRTPCAWLSHCSSALFPTPGASPPPQQHSPSSSCPGWFLLPWPGGPCSSLSSSLMPSSTALCVIFPSGPAPPWKRAV